MGSTYSNFVKKYTWIYRVYKIIKNVWNLGKNAFLTAKNYILNKPYEEYWEKTKYYGRITLKEIGKSTIVGKIYSIYKAISKAIKKVYNYYENSSKLIWNGYNYANNYIQGKDRTPFLNSLNRDWNSKYNFFQKIPVLNIQNYWNNNYKSILDKSKYIY